MRAPYDAMMYQYRTHVRVYPRKWLRHQSTKERHASSAHLGPAHRKASQRISHARRPALHARAHPRHHPHTQNRRPAHRGRYLRPVRPERRRGGMRRLVPIRRRKDGRRMHRHPGQPRFGRARGLRIGPAREKRHPSFADIQRRNRARRPRRRARPRHILAFSLLEARPRASLLPR